MPKTGLPIIWEAVHVFRANGDALLERLLASSSEDFALPVSGTAEATINVFDEDVNRGISEEELLRSACVSKALTTLSPERSVPAISSREQ